MTMQRTEFSIICVVWLIATSYIARVTTQEPFASIPQGRIAGIKVYTKSSLTPIEIFYGIPYAVPPTGRYRFSAPERHPGWRRTFFAHRMPPRCPQAGDTTADYISEDCLFINIWTPRRSEGNALPVVVILYSESWTRSGAATLPCEDLAAEGLVVVTVAYRLHILAFYTQKNIHARGNLALLDQYLALLWVRENIAAFGGDPTSITLMGHTAGADSILYHIASQRAVGLFHRAIVMSPRNIWRAIEEDSSTKIQDEAEQVSRMIAHDMGCSVGTNEEVLRCLRSRSFSDVMRTYSNINLTYGLQPVPDNFLPETEQYFPNTLAEAFSVSSKDQPMQLDLLLGTTDLEAINTNYDRYQELASYSKKTILDYAANKAIPELLRMLSFHETDMESMLTEAIIWEYWRSPRSDTKGSESVNGAIESLARMDSSVRWGAAAALLAARLARSLTRLYVYRYSQPGGTDLMGRQLNFTGAAHGTDLVALLGDAMMLQVARRRASGAEQQATELLRRYIVNFVKFGTPADENVWPRYRVGNAHVHNVRNNFGCDLREASRDVAFWLQYLPHLTGIFASKNTEQLPLEQVESRFRGGVFALCGVSLALLVLLGVCGAALRWERARRAAAAIDDPHTNL